MEQPDSPKAAPLYPIQTPPVPQDEDEHEPMFIQPHDPDYVPEPMYPEYIPLEDEYVLSAEEQPLPPVVSPTAESPGYVVESDPEEDLEEYEDDESEDGPVDYPMDGGDDGDDDDGDPSRDDADDEEKEEHLASVDSAIVVPTVELVSPPKGTEPVIPPPSTEITTTGAMITVRLQASIYLPPKAEVERFLAIPTAALPTLPLPPPLSIPPLVDRKDDIPQTELPPHKKSCLFALGPRYEVGESSTARPTRGRGIDYGFVSTLDAEDSPSGDHTDCGGGGLCFMRGLGSFIGLSQAVHYELQTHREQAKMIELRETDRRRQAQMVEILRVMRDMIREMGDMQAELFAPREHQRRARQPGSDSRVPNHQDASRDADSHI
nr:hypothetical protein [Tanacetum cinerariifolium]